MTYWLGQILALVAGLIGIGLVRGWVAARWPMVQEWHLDVALLLLLLAGIAMSGIIRHAEVKDASKLSRTVDALRDYAEVARLTPLGVTAIAGAGLKETTPLSEVLDGAWLERDGKLFPRCDNSSLERFRRLVEMSPLFPWSHYALAVCLRAQKKPIWRDHARKAVEILEATTLVADHHASHDEGLKELHGYLSAT